MNSEELVKTIQFDIKQCILRMHVDYNSLRLANVDPQVYYHELYNSILMQLKVQMIGQKIQSYKHPKTWIDAFKARWFPKFLLKKYPIEYVTINTWHCFPEYPIQNLGRPIQFFVLENESYDKITS